ncbi:MAG TPA: type II secretion system secretin GspD [Phycisphaeraceae bacterium]
MSMRAGIITSMGMGRGLGVLACAWLLVGGQFLWPAAAQEVVPEAAATLEQTSDAAQQPNATQASDQASDAIEEPVAALIGPAQPGEAIRLNFQDAPIDTVLRYLSEVAGLVVVQSAPLEGRISVVSRQDLSTDEAIAVLNSVLREKGMAAVRAGRTLKVMPLAQAKKSSIPVRVGADPSQIEPTDEVITQVIPIRNAAAPQLIQDLAPLISSEADVTANANSNVVVITDRSANIRRLVEIIAALDTTIAAVADVRVVPLRYANATEAARLANEIFGEGNASSRQPRSRQEAIRSFRARWRNNGESSSTSSNDPNQRVEAQFNASADQRTNTVVIAGAPQMLDVVEGVLKELDANPTADQGVMVYSVRHGQAANMASVLSALFQTSSTSTATGASGSQTPLRTRGSMDRRFGGDTDAQAPGTPQGQTSQGQGDRGPRTRLIDAIRQGLGADLSPESIESATDLIGQVHVVADGDTNSLLVVTSPLNFDRVRAIIAELDRPVPQVLIKVLIAEVTHSDSLDLGAEFSVLNLPDNSQLFTDFGVDVATGGIVYRLLEQDVQATLRALEEVGKLEVLSRPYVLASDNQTATITVGSEVPFIRNTRLTETGQTINTIQYDDVGIILNVTPHISPDGLVSMEVAPEISAISGETVPISETVDAPVIEKRSAQTRVAIRDGQTIVIGGLMEDQKNATISKVPLLGDIPLVGVLFQRQETEKRKTELLIFLTPVVAAQPEALGGISQHEVEGVEIVPHAVEPGRYQKHMEQMSGDGSPYPVPPAEERNPTNDPNEIEVDLPGQ